ncbi:MAG: metallophosphoesterase [Ignavibacteriae bacterium]|nr:MAG: metallophosphoesterase [Ignavibacteriota bacterium]
MGFFLTVILVVLLLQAFVYYRFIRFLKTTKYYKPSFKYIVLIPFVVFNVSFFIISFVFGRDFNPPEWFRIVGLYPFYVWEAATMFIGLILVAGWIIKFPFILVSWILKLIRPVRAKMEVIKQKPVVQRINTSRRKFLRTATFAVSAYAFSGATYGMIRHNSYSIETQEIKINNLPQELKGLTITLISDIHAGQYMTEDDMREYADALNELNSDIICIPGDFVNYQPQDINNFTKAFRDVKAKHGVYGTLGNHDYFVDPEYVAKAIQNDSPVKLLRNEFNKININGKELIILGVEDTRDAGVQMNKRVMGYIDNTLNSAKAGSQDFSSIPKILLCHKPYAFDDIAQREIDLTVAGHTHGGQVVPVKIGNFNMSFAALVSKYIDGLYTTGNKHLYVSRGIGSVGLPIRLNCPPEITKITLV